MLKVTVAILFGLALPAAAMAQTGGRFTFQPVEGGLMRLDTETGQVSHCTKAGDGFACRSVADDRAALMDEIERLKRENERLRQAAGTPPGGKGQGPAARLQLPSDEEIDKAMGLVENLMRRMLRTFRDEAPQAEPKRL
jgi:hypothetical protein